MKKIILIAILSMFTFLHARAQAVEEKFSTALVSVGINSACILDRSAVTCWGGDEGIKEVPVLKKPFQVSVGPSDACAIDQEGVKCWGFYLESKHWPMLVFKNPRQVSVSYESACALDDDGAKCWGANSAKDIPALINPSQISTGPNYACALDDVGVKCWGKPPYRQKEMQTPRLNNPVQVLAMRYQACSLDDDGVKCWGGTRQRCEQKGNGSICRTVDDDAINHLKAFGHPLKISGKYGVLCALYKDGTTKCDDFAMCGLLDDPQKKCDFLKDIKPIVNTNSQISVGSAPCTTSHEGLKCWDLYPSLANGHFPEYWSIVNRIPRDLKISSLPLKIPFDKYFSPTKRLWWEPLGSKIDKLYKDEVTDKKIVWLSNALMGPAIETADSSAFVDTLIPNYNSLMTYLSDLNLYFSIQDGMRRIADSQETRELALSSIHGYLKVLGQYLTPGTSSAHQEALRLLGQSMAAPMDNSCIQRLLAHLDSMKSEKELLQSNAKTKFLIPTLDLATQFLSIKAKL